MKKYMFIAAAAVCMASCINNDSLAPDGGQDGRLYLTAKCDVTKTAVQSDEKSVFWSPKEQIKVFYGEASLGAFESDNTEPLASVTFASLEEITADLTTGSDFVAVYPYAQFVSYDGEKVTLPLNLKYQTALAGTFADGVYPSAAKSASKTLDFKNILGGIKFKVEREDLRSVTFTAKSASAVLAADAVSFTFVDGLPVADLSTAVAPVNTITIGAPDGQTLAKDTWYYVAALPATLEGGLDITFRTATSEGAFASANTATIKRGVFGNVGTIDSSSAYEDVSVVNLSEAGTANCYLVSEAGTYKIQTVKGNSAESVGEVYRAETLWESFGTDVTPKEGALVGNVSYADGYITFSTTGVAGNAVIAAYDMFDSIVWSWHIWCSPTELSAMTQDYYNDAGTKVFTMMDRNLGATSGTPGSVGFLGLFYQWGRKDPFLGSCRIDKAVRAASTGEWPEAIGCDEFNGTVETAIANPTTFISSSSTYNSDWYYWTTAYDPGEKNTRWGHSKTIYDPCPAGWKLPFANGKNYPWRSAMPGTAGSVTEGYSVNSTTKCLVLTDVFRTKTPCVYPLGGYYTTSNSLITVGEKALYHSAAPSGAKVVQLYLQPTKVNAWYTDGRALGCALRCINAN